MIKILFKNKKFQILSLLIFLLIDFYLDVERKATILTFIFFVVVLINSNMFQKHIDLIYKERSLKNVYVFIYLMLITFLTQNYLLIYEIIDWDISSYMITSNSVMNGSLPYEVQWESKGPLLYYLYGLVMKIVGGNYIYFKLANDFILCVIAFILFLSINSNKNTILSIIGSTLFILLFSQPWAVSGYSELYCLLFIALSYYSNIYTESKKYLLIGLLMAGSTLINQGTILFVIPFLVVFLSEKNINNILKFSFGFIFPYIIFILLFSINGLMDIFIATYITIPLEYTSENFANLYELKVFFRKFFEYNSYLYYALIAVFLSLVITTFQKIKVNPRDLYLDMMLIFASLLFYFIGSHNYYHHLLFLLFFVSLFIKNIKSGQNIYLIFIFVSISLISLVSVNGKNSFEALSNLEETYTNYPLKKLSAEIDGYFNKDYEVLALEYNLILHYLEKNNYSYIVHHTNFLEPYIISTLEDINYIKKDYINYLIANKPDVVICTEWMIVRGDPIKNPIVNCSKDIFDNSYIQLNTDKYFNKNLNYYNDPYKEIKVFIKTQS